MSNYYKMQEIAYGCKTFLVSVTVDELSGPRSTPWTAQSVRS